MATDWLLIDGSSVMFRAFFGIPVTAFKAPDGQPVNAVRGFLDMLGRLVTDRKPRAIVVGPSATARSPTRSGGCSSKSRPGGSDGNHKGRLRGEARRAH